MSYVVPTIRERGATVRAIAAAMHEAAEAMRDGARDGRLVCGRCGGAIRWAGNGARSAGSCSGCRDVRWAT